MGLKLAIRGIRRYPAVFGSVAFAIGLSIAVCTSLFSVLDGILFRALPLADSDRLAVVDYRPVGGRPPLTALLPELAKDREALRARITGSPLVTAYADARFAVFFDAYESERQGLRVQAVDSRFWPLVGVSPAIGTNFSEQDERASSVVTQPSPEPLPIIISDRLWRDTFGSGSIAGIHELAGRRIRVVGVMPTGVKYPGETNVWVPIPPRADQPPKYIRLAAGATVSQLQSLVPELRVRPVREEAFPQESTGIALLFGSALLLLAMTWVQVTGVVFLWATRQAESTAIRFALGASRWHFLRQFAIQGGLVALAAFATAALTLQPLTDVIIANLPEELTRGQYLRPNHRAFLFLGGVSLVGFVLLSLAALRASVGISAVDVLRIQPTGSPAHQRTVRRVLLSAQLALTSLLLYLTGLAAHSFGNAITMDYGFDTQGVMIFSPPRPLQQSDGKDRRLEAARFKQLLNESIERVTSQPGVAGAATAFSGPLGIANQRPPLRIESLDGRPLIHQVEALGNAVSTQFIPAMGATLLEGRSFDDPEFRSRSDVMLVNETLAKQLTASMGLSIGEFQIPVIGQRVTTDDGTAQIIGVIRDFVGSKINVASPPQYFTHDPQSLGSAVLFVRTDLAPRTAASTRKALESVWGPLSDRHFAQLSGGLEPLLAPYKSQATLLAFVAFCCLPIAVVGLAAAVSNGVRTRRSELAIHLAIGARPNDIRLLVMREALAATLAGLLSGSLLGSIIGSAISSQLFGVFPIDALTIILVSTILAGLCGIAAWIPVRKASRLEPALILGGRVGAA